MDTKTEGVRLKQGTRVKVPRTSDRGKEVQRLRFRGTLLPSHEQHSSSQTNGKRGATTAHAPFRFPTRQTTRAPIRAAC